MHTILYTDTTDFQKKLRNFCERTKVRSDISEVVAQVLADVRKRGDAAILEYTRKFDQTRLTTAAQMRVSAMELKDSLNALSTNDRQAIEQSIRMVRDFHRKTLPENWEAKNAQEATVGERFYPIQRVGLYIPGGHVPLISTAVMTAALAKLVNCPEIAVCTPPDATGRIAPGILAVLSILEIEEVYKVGGIQAIGGMAFGTQTIPAVDKIFGPGNAFVMESKRQVLGNVGIDLLPGPSEVMIIADAGAQAEHVAADLLAQAEHGSGQETLYIATIGPDLIEKVNQAIKEQIPRLNHGRKCADIIKNRCLSVSCETIEQAAQVANYIAPEHLELQVADDLIEPLTQQVTTAGAILQGYMTPTALGDFTAGPSHTLPTGRSGRFFSGLQARDFMRRSGTVRYDAKSLAKAAPVVEVFARLEQLDAHAKSLTIRLPKT